MISLRNGRVKVIRGFLVMAKDKLDTPTFSQQSPILGSGRDHSAKGRESGVRNPSRFAQRCFSLQPFQHGIGFRKRTPPEGAIQNENAQQRTISWPDAAAAR